MTNSHKNIVNQFLESSALLIMTFPEIVESKDLLWGRTCAVDNVHARRKGVLGKLYEMQISSERGLRNSLKFPSYFGMEYVRPWNMGKKYIYIPLKFLRFPGFPSQPCLFFSQPWMFSQALENVQVQLQHLRWCREREWVLRQLFLLGSTLW